MILVDDLCLFTGTPDRYISIIVSSTLLSRRQYRSMMVVSKEVPLKHVICNVTLPEVDVMILS